MIALVLPCLLELCHNPVVHCLHVEWPPTACRAGLWSAGQWLSSPFGHGKQGCTSESSRQRTTNPTVFLFSGILKYGMEYWWAAISENLWKGYNRGGGRCWPFGVPAGEFWPAKLDVGQSIVKPGLLEESQKRVQGRASAGWVGHSALGSHQKPWGEAFDLHVYQNTWTPLEKCWFKGYLEHKQNGASEFLLKGIALSSSF